MYQALYRKWRPKTFDEVIGQQHITETLKSQVKNDRLSHAYLFIGTRGTGKTTCARILARAVNCEHPENGNPCGKCAACRGILEGSVMDVVELDAASNNSVDNVRALREEAVFSPTTVKKRVYIIDEVHMLSMAAFNALLKILEEPPEHLMFILATTELQKVPATILSRCQRHSFRRLESETISNYLLEIAGRENLSLEKDAADLIARLSDGGVRDSLSLLDQCSSHETIDVEAVYSTVGLAGKRRISELLDAILRHNSEKALQLFAALWMEGKDPASVLRELITLLRDVMLLLVAPKAGLNLISGGFEERTLQYFGKRMTTEQVVAAMETIQKTLSTLRDVSNPRTAAELCLVSLCCDSAGDSIASLRSRISKLEEQVERGVPMAPMPLQPYTLREEPQSSVPEEYPRDDDEEPYPEDPISEPPEDDEPCPEDTTSDEVHAAEIRESFSQPAAAEQAPSPEPAPSAPAPSGNSRELWNRIRGAVMPALPFDVQMLLQDEERVTDSLDGNTVLIETQNDFQARRFQRQDVLQKFQSVGREILGHDVRVLARERQTESRATRSLDDLRQFKEVHFISE